MAGRRTSPEWRERVRLIAAEHPEYGAPAIYGRLGAMEWPSKNDGPPSIPTVTRILREFRGEDALTQRLYAPAS